MKWLIIDLSLTLVEVEFYKRLKELDKEINKVLNPDRQLKALENAIEMCKKLKENK